MKPILLNKNQLEHDYLVEGLSFSDLAVKNNCGRTTIRHYLQRYNVKIRGKESYRQPIRIQKLKEHCCRNYGFSKDDLICLYVNEGMSSRDISKLYSCTQKVVMNRLRLWNIPIRTKKEAYNMPRRLKRIGDIWRGKGFMSGKKFSNIHREKLSKSKELYWIDVLGEKPRVMTEYTLDFNDLLKEKVRERDGHLCQICGISQNGTKHPIHHIDYIKNHNNMTNLITLCKSCHRKTNTNRESWTEYFRNRLLTN